MPSPRSSEAPSDLLVEALEPRIAPTGLVGHAGSILNAADQNYLAYNIAPSPGHLGFIPQGNGVFAIPLSGDGNGNGDVIGIFNGAGGSNAFPTFLQANGGQILAFFKDFNNDGQVNTNELVGISMGSNSSAAVNGNVNGDVVANLAADGVSVFNTSSSPANEVIAGFRAVNVFGSVAAGGGISNLSISQNVEQVLAGTAASGFAYHFSGTPNGAATGFYAVAAPDFGQSGAGINNVNLGSVGLIKSGEGGLNASGGAITGVLINADTNGFTIESGPGGAGAGAKGGAGGTISTVTIGLQPNVNDSTAHDAINIIGGHGGAAEFGQKGGAGGLVDNVAVGFSLNDNGNRVQSAFLLSDDVTLHGGAGGDGFKGGTGGAVTSSLVYVATPDNPGGASAADPAVVKIFGGDGGAQVSGGFSGKSGKGGGVLQVDVRDLLTDNTRTTFTGLPAGVSATNTQLLVEGGHGGLVLDSGKGKFGGSVSDVTLLGYRLDVTAGDGADGYVAGGAGGSLTNVTVLNRSDLLPTELILDAGQGGGADNGFAGSGGAITTVRVNDSSLANLLINEGTHANGGAALGGAGTTGGAGGSVMDVIINGSRAFFNNDSSFRIAPGNALIRAGDGGLGPNGGGTGGSLDTVQVIGANFQAQVLAGNGGAAFAEGSGGAGGNLTGIGISNQPLPVPVQVQFGNAPDTSLELRAGAGGDGNGFGAGGVGGTVTSSSLVSTQNAVFTAGAGGSGFLGAAGSGGSVTNSQALAAFGSVTATGGSAGANGGLGGSGGNVDTFVGSAGNLISSSRLGVIGDPRADVTRGNFTLTAGNGSAGGAGGSVLNSGTSTLTPGSVTVTAGNGSGQNATAGAGGVIDGFTGFIGGFGATRFTAGNGGSGDGAAGAGGAINNVSLTGGLGIIIPSVATSTNTPIPVALTFDAGTGGDAGGGRKGANGGSINNVNVANLATNTVLHHLAAGDGGNGQFKGGKGGSVTNIHVGLPVQFDAAGLPQFENADIGLRTGVNFGYDPTQDPVTGAFRTAGGIFAGAGGSGQVDPRPGSVNNVNAAAIASIVAGKGNVPKLVNTVDRIFLNGLSTPLTTAQGDFTNFNRDVVFGSIVQSLQANVVGSVVNPTPGGGGSTFKFIDTNGDGVFQINTDIPLDGLIAAFNLTQNRNFIPEALLSLDRSVGQFQLLDMQEPTIVVTGA